jgi:hypothetical protein
MEAPRQRRRAPGIARGALEPWQRDESSRAALPVRPFQSGQFLLRALEARLCLGYERVCQEFPERLLTDSSQSLVARGELGLKLGPNQTLLEATCSTEAPHPLD